MAKTIKFNLICDNQPIRTIEDLQNNFSIEDVLTYYNNRLLHRWLEVRVYKDFARFMKRRIIKQKILSKIMRLDMSSLLMESRRIRRMPL